MAATARKVLNKGTAYVQEAFRSSNLSHRRTALKAGLAAGAVVLLLRWFPGQIRPGAELAPIKIGFQSHRTGIGAAYGRWWYREDSPPLLSYDFNAAGGINGRPVEVVIEDDGTDPG